MKKSQAQKELPGMPERSDLAKKALEYVNAKDEVESAQRLQDKVKAELIQEFIKSGQTSVKVAGHTVSYSHTEQDKIITKAQ